MSSCTTDLYKNMNNEEITEGLIREGVKEEGVDKYKGM